MYISGKLKFKRKYGNWKAALEDILRKYAKLHVLGANGVFPANKEEYDQMLDEAKDYLFREVCDDMDWPDNQLVLKWYSSTERPESFEEDELNCLLLFAGQAGLRVTGHIYVTYADSREEYWTPGSSRTGYKDGFKKISKSEWELQYVPAPALWNELKRRYTHLGLVNYIRHWIEGSARETCTDEDVIDLLDGMWNRFVPYRKESESIDAFCRHIDAAENELRK